MSAETLHGLRVEGERLRALFHTLHQDWTVALFAQGGEDTQDARDLLDSIEHRMADVIERHKQIRRRSRACSV